MFVTVHCKLFTVRDPEEQYGTFRKRENGAYMILLNPMEMLKLYTCKKIYVFITSVRGLFSEIDSHAYGKI